MMKTTRRYFAFLIFYAFWTLVPFPGNCQPSALNDPPDTLIRKTVQIIFYNVENLFHPSDDSLKRDEEFTPGGNHYWSYRKYNDKLQKIAKVFIAMGGQAMPDIIGVCEIENRRVLEDLLNRTVLNDSNYGIIHKESPDPRGIDVALLYNRNSFEPEGYEAVSMETPGGVLMRTRDILHVWGNFHGHTECHFFVNHWPSRRGGKLESDKKREWVATRLAACIDSLFSIDPESNIVLMGDFNDEPQDRALSRVLGACDIRKQQSGCTLYNLMFENRRKGEGSHFRKNNFYESSIFDQIIVSGSVAFGTNGLSSENRSASIFRKSFLLNEKNGMPLRTYQGLKYLGGFSDHLPVMIDLQLTH